MNKLHATTPHLFPRGWLWIVMAFLPWLPGFSGQGVAEAPAATIDQTRASDNTEWVSDPNQRAHLLGLGVKPWFDRGMRGQGLKVAVLDSGFQGFKAYLGKGI